MHELAPLIIDLAIILGVASLIAIICQKIKQPVVLGYLIGGIIIGPYTPPYNLITDIENVQIISELGVIFLMFSLGLEFSFHKLKRVGFASGITGIFEVIGMLIIGFLTGKILGWSFYDCIFLGAALSVSSTTIIIKAISELRLKKQRFAESIYGILIVEDLLAILLLVALTTAVATQDFFSITLAWSALKLLLVVGGWFLIGYLLVPSLMQHIRHYINEETLTLISIALCLFLVCIAAYFDYSTALGAFIMGSILAETTLIHRIEQLTAPIRDIFGAVFFVSVGMLINPGTILEFWPIILLICLITVLGKLFVTGIGSFLSGQSFTDSVRIGFSMAQIGEFSFIIAGLGLTLDATSNQLYPIIVAVSLITTFTTPYLIRFSGKFSERLLGKFSPSLQEKLSSYTLSVKKLLANPVQQDLYNKAILRLLVNGVVVAIIFTLTENLVLPEIIYYIEPTWMEKGLAWIIAMLLASPFIWGMLSAFRGPRYLAQGINTAAVRHFCWAITALEMSILSITYFERWILSVLLFMAAAVLFKLFYRQLDNSYQWFENQLVSNLQAHESNAEHEKQPAWNADPIELKICSNSSLIGSAINYLDIRNEYGINIIAIYHNERLKLVKNHQLHILAQDRIVVIGAEEDVSKFCDKFKLET